MMLSHPQASAGMRARGRALTIDIGDVGQTAASEEIEIELWTSQLHSNKPFRQMKS
jgi:hypothetical protein